MIYKTVKRWQRTVQRSVGKLFGVNEFVWQAISRLGFAGGSAMAASGILVNAETAMTVAAYKRAVELLSHHVAKTSFIVKAGVEQDRRHPASSLVRWWARHHEMSAFEFRRTLMVHALTSGNGYAYIRRERSVPVELILLEPSAVNPQLVQGRLQYQINGRPGYVSPSDVIHIKGMGFNGYVGLDPIRYYAKEVLGLAIATQTYAAKYYENGGTPSAYLKSEVPLTDEQFNRLKGEAGPLKRSVENPHELPILEQTDIKSVGLTAEQTQLLSARKDIILDIANLLGIPPHKLGLAISTSYGSLEEENEAFRHDALDPWLVQFEMEFRKLLTEDEQAEETHEVCADRNDLTRLKATELAEYLSTLGGGVTVMTVNELRSKVGLPPVPGGDKLLSPLNMAAAQQPTGNPDPTQPKPEPQASSPAPVSGDPPPEDPESRSRIRAHQLQALEDVYSRMTKRLATAAGRVKRSDQLTEFRAALTDHHLAVVRSALAPIVPLCGGDDAGPFAAELLTEFRHQLDRVADSADLPAAIAEASETFTNRSRQLAESALTRMST